MDRKRKQDVEDIFALRQDAPALAHTIMVVEEERRWIAAEVHDRIAQNLAGVFHHLQTLESNVADDPQAQRVLLRSTSLLREAIQECRDIMKELHPPGLDEFGVVPLIEEELEQLSEDTGCDVRFLGDRKVRRSGHVEVTLYRIFHEALTNIRRHAPTVRKVMVTFERQHQAIILQIEDDGPGFDVTATRQGQHVRGLMSMQRRAEIIGGTLEVSSIPGQGTRVAARVPLEPSPSVLEL